MRTAVARKALPARVPMADAVANVARGALLTLGLSTGDFSLVAPGLEDRLHQPYRAHLFPQSMALLARAREFGAIGATISGAGPTVLFWTQADGTGAVMQKLRGEARGLGRRAARAVHRRRRRRPRALEPTGYARIRTVVPSGRRSMSQRMSRSPTRTQPLLAAVPIVASFDVPWIAIRSPPVQPWGMFGWRPVRAIAQQP